MAASRTIRSGRLKRVRNRFSVLWKPGDLESLGLATGDIVEIKSNYSSILGVVEAEDAIRAGVISMPHGFGDAPGSDQDSEVRTIGSNTGRLSSVDRDFDPYSGIPLMSAIPVNLSRVSDPAAT